MNAMRMYSWNRTTIMIARYYVARARMARRAGWRNSATQNLNLAAHERRMAKRCYAVEESTDEDAADAEGYELARQSRVQRGVAARHEC